ncbi:MAG: DUF1476 domain-containing protein [Rhodobacteraceae bacterium]|nr:DUF1476 domain-containing protein [Paracoccaceae bacterium]
MGDAFQDLEKGFERKFELDEEQKFKVGARRDKLFGLWIAKKLGHTGPAAEQYAADVVNSNFAKPGDEDMLDKVRADLKAMGVVIEDRELRRQLNTAANDAAEAIVAAAKG